MRHSVSQIIFRNTLYDKMLNETGFIFCHSRLRLMSINMIKNGFLMNRVTTADRLWPLDGVILFFWDDSRPVKFDNGGAPDRDSFQGFRYELKILIK